MSSPPKRMLPEVGVLNKEMARPVVVLPEPDSPTNAWVVPRATEKLMSSTAVKSPKRWLSPSTSSKVSRCAGAAVRTGAAAWEEVGAVSEGASASRRLE